MGRHAFRGAVTAWMALIVLRTVGTAGGSGKIASLFSDLDGLVTRALSPDVPLIPDRRAGAASTGPAGYFHLTPAELKAALAAGKTADAAKGVYGPHGALNNMPNLDQYVHGGSLAGLADNPALR